MDSTNSSVSLKTACRKRIEVLNSVMIYRNLKGHKMVKLWTADSSGKNKTGHKTNRQDNYFHVNTQPNPSSTW